MEAPQYREGDIVTFNHVTGFGLTLTLTGRIIEAGSDHVKIQTIHRYNPHTVFPSQIQSKIRGGPQAA